MTGQPRTQDELAEANHRANKDDDEVPEDIKNHPLTRESLKDDDSDDDDTLEELREFKETVREQGNDELGVYGEPQTDDDSDDETTMVVTDESGDEHELTREDVETRRDVRDRTWKMLERKGGVFVKVAHWFDDEDVRKAKTGRGFHGRKTDETEKAIQFTTDSQQGHTADEQTLWIPKKAVQTYELT